MSLLEKIVFATNGWIPLLCFFLTLVLFCLGNGGFINSIYSMVAARRVPKPKQLFFAALWECFALTNFLLTLGFYSEFLNIIAQ